MIIGDNENKIFDWLFLFRHNKKLFFITKMNLNHAGAFTLFFIIYILFLSIVVDVNCCGRGCFGGDEGGGGDGYESPTGFTRTVIRSMTDRDRHDKKVQKPSEADTFLMAAPNIERIVERFNGGMESGRTEIDLEIAKTNAESNKQNGNMEQV